MLAPGHLTSGHQVSSSDETSQKRGGPATVTAVEMMFWFVQDFSSLVPTIRISRNFDINDLRSGHFCDLSITSQWEENRLPLKRS